MLFFEAGFRDILAGAPFPLALAWRPSPGEPPLKLVSFFTHVEKGRRLACRSERSSSMSALLGIGVELRLLSADTRYGMLRGYGRE